MTNQPAPQEGNPDTLGAVEAMVNDAVLQGRVRAAAAQKQGEGFTAITDPVQWAWENRYPVAAAPGFSAQYEYAVLSGNPNPGGDPAVITDDQIRGQVQHLVEPPVVELPEA